MLSKNSIKHINSLYYSKFRKKNKMFVAEGPKIVGELADSGFVIDSVFAVREWIEKNENNPIISKIHEISAGELKKISSLKTPNQVLAVVNIPDEKTDFGKLKNELFLVLDGISDPGNLGTIIRTADWFGIRNIVCSKNTVNVYNPKVIQATMGSFIRVKIIYNELSEFFTNLPFSTPVFGALLNGENIYRMKLPAKGCIIIGNESKGISAELKRFITHSVTIPSSGGSTSAESLNASVATAVILSEFKRGKL
jgi:TrmH family RNA methyltransferase